MNLNRFQTTSKRKEWRKLVKKLRRQKVRQNAAREREKNKKIQESSPSFLEKLKISELLEEEERNIAEKESCLRHQEWLKAEETAQKRFKELQEVKAKAERAKIESQLRIQKEWDEAMRLKEEKQRLELQRQELTKAKIDNFVENGGEIPGELLELCETNPGKEICPFFSKVAACRFGPACSRNHVIPTISKIIVIPSFYSHFTLYQNRSSEYDTDVGLEFEEKDTYKDFRDFFEDVSGELTRYGELSIIQVCRNAEQHLRGNLYAEYKTERSAFTAARALNARWYAGKQLTVRFAIIPDWGAAVCGDFKRGRCPKGSECNFLHVFRNPRGQLQPLIRHALPITQSTRSWRWSESPERKDEGISEKNKRNGSRDSLRRRDRSRNEKQCYQFREERSNDRSRDRRKKDQKEDHKKLKEKDNSRKRYRSRSPKLSRRSKRL